MPSSPLSVPWYVHTLVQPSCYAHHHHRAPATQARDRADPSQHYRATITFYAIVVAHVAERAGVDKLPTLLRRLLPYLMAGCKATKVPEYQVSVLVCGSLTAAS